MDKRPGKDEFRSTWKLKLGAAGAAAAMLVVGTGFADPFTANESSSTDLTFATGDSTASACLPYVRHRSGGVSGSTVSDQAAGHSLDRAALRASRFFSDNCNLVWSPSVIRSSTGGYIMHFTANRAGRGQQCIGTAHAANLAGPYGSVGVWACPGDGRWTLDSDDYRGPNGSSYVAYRDDEQASNGCQTAISVVQTNASTGAPIWSTRVTALRSDWVGWNDQVDPSAGCPSRAHLIENPAMIRGPDGVYYLWFSTGNWHGSNEATGIAQCGTSPIPPATGCRLIGSTTRPYYACTCSGLNPLLVPPGNHPSDGGMTPYFTAGEMRVAWSWFDGQNRHLQNDLLHFYPGFGWVIGGGPGQGIAATKDGRGYWLVGADGGVSSFGDAHFSGSMAGKHLNAPVVGIAADPDGKGYWLVSSDGGVFAFDAPSYGSMGGKHLNAPIVGMAPTKSGHGYWLVASDGGVFSFGDAHFSGSMGGKHLNAPVVGMAADRDGSGYWLVARDGGIFSFDAHFWGSMGGKHLNAPVVGMAADPDGSGYWLVASDGGIFSFAAPFSGSMGGTHLVAPVRGIAADPNRPGYWLSAGDGGVFAFDAPFFGRG